MDKYIDSRFERLEKSLGNLIDSVTKYHPSLTLAEELKAADMELSKALEQVQAHQANHLRIQKLRQASASLDAQIRDVLTSLATARRDLVSTPTTTFPSEANYPLRYDELLSYARRISKTTMPPATALDGPRPLSPETQTPLPDGQPPSAINSSAPTPSQTQSPAANTGPSQLESEQPSQQGAASVSTSIPEGMSRYLNPLSGQIFYPWPLEDKIRSGSLASYQVIADQGIDPKGYDPIVEEERKRKDEAERKAKEDEEKAEREERESQMQREQERLRAEREREREQEQDEWRRASVAGIPTAPSAPTGANASVGEKKQFQFTNLDDLDDDEND